MSARVAVVIPAWDAYVGWLEEAVASVLDQGAAAEVIVVDNASDVPVPEIAGTRVVRSDARLTTGAARNLGLDAVSAPLVVFLDADDVMLPGSVEALIAGIEAYPDAVAFVLRIVEGDTGKRHRSPRPFARRLARLPRVFAFANSVWSLLPTQGATVMRTQAVRDAGGYANRTQGEDWVLGAALAWRGSVRFGADPALVYRWRWDSPGRVSSIGTLVESSKSVRIRLRERSSAPRAVLPVVTAGQLLTIAAARPAFRAMRRVLRR